jgi:hypothetical protein
MSPNSTLRPSIPESLKPPYHTPSASTADDMHSANSSTNVHKTPKSVWEDAIDARESAITALETNARDLGPKAGASLNDQERTQLYDLSLAITRYVDRARKVYGPTVDLITTGLHIESHHGLDPDDALKFVGVLSLALRKTKLGPLIKSTSLDQNQLVSIADSVRTIERATYDILSAHQDLDNPEIERYGDEDRRITMGENEYWDATSLYNLALRKEMGKQPRKPKSTRRT